MRRKLYEIFRASENNSIPRVCGLVTRKQGMAKGGGGANFEQQLIADRFILFAIIIRKNDRAILKDV